MATKTFCEVDLVLYFSGLGVAPDMRRLVHALRCDMARNGKSLRIGKHVAGRFLEFDCPAGQGSVVYAPVPIAEELCALQTARASQEMRAMLARHSAHLHIRLTTEAGCPSGIQAGRRLLKSALGTLRAHDPVAVWSSPEARLMTPDEAAVWVGADAAARAQHLPDMAALPAAAEAGLLRSAEAATRLIHGRSQALAPAITPRRVTLAEGQARTHRPRRADSETGRAYAAPTPAAARISLLARLPALPFGISYGSMGRVAAGMVTGAFLSNVVQIGPSLAAPTLVERDANVLIQTVAQLPEAEHMCGWQTPPHACPEAFE